LDSDTKNHPVCIYKTSAGTVYKKLMHAAMINEEAILSLRQTPAKIPQKTGNVRIT
jgi:hypothetical protein